LALQIKKAQRSAAKLRMALSGPSGSGKTYTALTIAAGLGGRIVVIDTEAGAASLYADQFDFDIGVMEAPFHPHSLADALEELKGDPPDVVIVDSLSHFWAGKGGCLELKEQLAIKYKMNPSDYRLWQKLTPIWNRMLDAMLQAPHHVIWCMRAKQQYVEKKKDDSQPMASKIGLDPIARPGVEYEADIFCEIDMDHNLIITKTRCFELTDAVINKPRKELGERIGKWLKGNNGK